MVRRMQTSGKGEGIRGEDNWQSLLGIGYNALHGVDLVNAPISKKDLQYYIHMVWGGGKLSLDYTRCYFIYICAWAISSNIQALRTKNTRHGNGKLTGCK